MNEGDAWFKMDSATKFRDYTPADFIPNALHAYRQGLTVLETFLIPNTTGQRRYLWDGMQTFHYSFRQRIAACMKRMGILSFGVGVLLTGAMIFLGCLGFLGIAYFIVYSFLMCVVCGVGVLCLALSALIRRAAQLKEENDLTI